VIQMHQCFSVPQACARDEDQPPTRIKAASQASSPGPPQEPKKDLFRVLDAHSLTWDAPLGFQNPKPRP
jgi:hypothetical protein